MRAARGCAGVLALAALLAPARGLAAGAYDDEPATPTRVQSVEERARAPRSWLDLGAHGRPGAVTYQTLLDAPRFQSSIDVEAKAPQDLNVTMAVWWHHFDLPKPSPYGHANTTAYRPGTAGAPAVNLLPVFGWIADKIKDRKNRD
jgi:hypothetical protein